MYIIVFVFGLAIGSFINALVFRLHNGESILKGRSHCTHCKNTLRWFELIPIASFVIQKGRCRSCGEKISWQYPIVELATGILFLLFNIKYSILNIKFNNLTIWQYLISNIQYLAICFLVFLFSCFIVSVLIIIFVYDLKYGEIPDIITLPAIVILSLFSILIQATGYGLWATGYELWDTGFEISNLKLVISNLFLAILIGGGFFLFQYLISRGRWIGGGDIRLGALMGVILGWPNILFALFTAYIIGAIVSVFLLILKKKKLADATPFGTYLTIATFIAMFWGDNIINWYLGLIG